MPGCLADEGGRRAPLQPGVGLLQPLVAPHRAAQLDLRPHRRQQLVVVPRLLDVVARAAAHGLDRPGDAAEPGHHQDRQRRVERPDALHQVEAFLARRRVAGVVEIEDDEVEVRRLEALEGLGRRAGRRDLVALVEQQELAARR